MRSAFTIATGPKSYKRMAINCAHSFRRWNDIPFVIYSDDELLLPAGLKDVEVRIIDKYKYGFGFSVKLHMDRFAITEKSLFIDADCLVVGDLSPLFDAFDGKPVGILGVMKSDGELFGNVSEICSQVGIPALPQFNGGLYYVEKGPDSDRIFIQARQLEPDYDRLGIVRLRGQPNDEMLIGIALAKAGVLPVLNSGEFYADLQWWPEVLKFDVLKGVAQMRNPPKGAANHQDIFPASEALPLVVHFLGHHVEGVLYKRETIKLRFSKFTLVARLVATVATLPQSLWLKLKDVFRPLFRRFLGFRSIRRSKQRLIID